MTSANESFSQVLDEARQLLPKLGDFPELCAEGKKLAESLQYYVELLSNENTTAVDLGSETKQILQEIAENIGQLTDQLAPDTPEIRVILERVGYYS